MMRFFLAMWLLVGAAASPALAEDGYRLWLRYEPLPAPAATAARPLASSVLAEGESPTILAASAELRRGLRGLLGREPRLVSSPENGTILLGTPASSPLIASLNLPLSRLGDEGFLLRSAQVQGKRLTLVAANGDKGLLYGTFAFLRHLQTGGSLDRLDLADAPARDLRMLNHWDNLDGTVERGYAGFSIFDWHRLPHWVDPRITDYARANASVGINATVLTNVNANAEVLTDAYLVKVAALAERLRPWGIRVYLTARFSAPMELAGLKTADPLDPAVQRWWRSKAADIYRLIPDFGGFLVKANSEGQPGPQDFGRSHAEGANLLADALAPHGGKVIWRAFVYSAKQGEDRARQAFDEFRRLDGKFRPNVLLQVKNGPIDFQPREPFHPLFGQMPATPLVLEAQITKEYLGFSTHLAYLGTMWEEVLDSATGLAATPSVSSSLSGMAGVANIGSDRNWSGSHFDQANWFAFGRLAWNPDLSARAIAEDWTRLTWGNDPVLVREITAMMMGSHQAVVDYMTPLGLHHLMGTDHHYGPAPWVDDLARADWNPTYYHRADKDGIGFDRSRSGSRAVDQYARPLADRFNDPDRVGEDLLLWFHRRSWDHRMQSGRTLWEELIHRYDRGVGAVDGMRERWAGLKSRVDPERHAEVSAFLAIQAEEARWWRNASIAYWQHVSGRPLPPGVAPPPRSLAHYKSLRFPYAPGHWD